jgi:hypothetical protein
MSFVINNSLAIKRMFVDLQAAYQASEGAVNLVSLKCLLVGYNSRQKNP